MVYSWTTGLVKVRRPPTPRFFQATCASVSGHVDIGEDRVVVAAKQRSVDLLKLIHMMNREAKLCLDCLGCLGWPGWLA